MSRDILVAGAAALALLVPAAPAAAQQSAMGGGFIELLMTGRNPGPARHAPPLAPAPEYGVSAPVRAYRTITGSIPVSPHPQAPLPGVDPRQPLPQHAALSPDYRQIERSLDPKYLPQVVDYAGSHRPGTIVIDTPNKFLYLVEGNGKARRYGIGVGRPGFEWAGAKTITRKAEWPDWRPPPQMLQRRPDLPRYMAGGPENPMGARGLYLGSSLYRIHGTNEPHTIGQAVSSGCIRMRNEDVTDLYDRVRVGTRVIVI